MLSLLTLFIIGLVFGSFINALVYRIENKVTLWGRSFCPSCKHPISWYDNIPVLSWIFLGRKCRSCRRSISFQYPFVELLTGLAFIAMAYSFGYISKLNTYFSTASGFTFNDFFALSLLLFASFILVLNAVYDYKTGYLLSTYIYIGILAVGAYLVSNGWLALNMEYFLPYSLSAFFPALVFFSLSYFSKGHWMGEGDWELAVLMGLLLGYPKIVVALYFAFIVGAIIGLIGIFQKKLKMKTAIPFGPYLIAGTFFSLLFGEQLFSIYVKIVLGG